MLAAPTDRLSALSHSTCRHLRARFLEVGFHQDALATAERIAPGMFDAVRLPLVKRALSRQGTPAADLVRLFQFNDRLTADAVAAALGPEGRDALVQAGILEPSADGLRAHFRLTPFEDLWLLHDDPAAGEDAAMGPGPTTQELVRWMPAAMSGSALDVGCGAGTLALVAARRGAGRVLGTDINSRAVAIATFNAGLNGLSAEFRTGDLLAPVGPERFDWVLAQPPYVIHPPDVPQVTFLHGGTLGDELALSLLAQLPAALAPQSCALVLFDSPVRRGEPLLQRIRRALGDAPLDLAVLTTKGPPPDLQAIAYASLQVPDFGPDYDTTVRRYRDHLESLSVSELAHALVVLRASPASEARFAVSLPARSLQVPPGSLEGLLKRLDQASVSDAALLTARIHPALGARFHEERERADLASEPKRWVRFVTPPALDQEITEASQVLLAVLEQSETLGKGLARYAEACGASVEEVRAEVVGFVRRGLAQGLLEPG